MLAKLGIPVTCSDIFGVWGNAWFDGLALPQPYAGKVASLRTLIAGLNTEITLLDAVIADLLACHDGYHALQVHGLPRRPGKPATWPRRAPAEPCGGNGMGRVSERPERRHEPAWRAARFQHGGSCRTPTWETGRHPRRNSRYARRKWRICSRVRTSSVFSRSRSWVLPLTASSS